MDEASPVGFELDDNSGQLKCTVRSEGDHGPSALRDRVKGALFIVFGRGRNGL